MKENVLVNEKPFVRNVEFERFVRERCEKFVVEVKKVIVGDDDIVECILIALFSGSSLILESRPGEGKSLLARTVAAALSLDAKWRQFKGDDMPADLLGYVYRNKEGQKEIQYGDVFTNIFLADELNRAPSKAKSPLLGAMEEKFVKIPGNDVVTNLPDPFLLIATQNPIEESTDTYGLGRAEVNRFGMKLKISMLSVEDIKKMMARDPKKNLPKVQAVLTKEQVLEIIAYVKASAGSAFMSNGLLKDIIEDPVLDYMARLGYATNFTLEGKETKEGASNRLFMSFWLIMNAYRLVKGLDHLNAKDLKQMVSRVWLHRMNAESDERAAAILEQTLNVISPVPGGTA